MNPHVAIARALAAPRTVLPVLLLLSFAGVGALACRKAEPPAAPAPSAATAPATAPAPTMAGEPAPAPAAAPGPTREILTGVAVGANNRVVAPQDRFAPSDTIYVSVVTTGLAPGTALRARWLYEGEQLVTESTQTVAGADATSEFHAANPGGWPAGTYRVDLFAGDQALGSATFKVAGEV